MPTSKKSFIVTLEVEHFANQTDMQVAEQIAAGLVRLFPDLATSEVHPAHRNPRMNDLHSGEFELWGVVRD